MKKILDPIFYLLAGLQAQGSLALARRIYVSTVYFMDFSKKVCVFFIPTVVFSPHPFFSQAQTFITIFFLHNKFSTLQFSL